MRSRLRAMTDEELRELIRACAREIAWRKEQKRRAEARAEREVGLDGELLALARRARLPDEDIRMLLGSRT